MADALGAVNSIVLPAQKPQNGVVKKNPFLLTAFLALVACAPVSVFYSQGAAPAKVKDDRLNCAVEALAKAPVATQIRQRAPRYIPGARYCPAAGNCYARGGFFVSGEVYSVDVNAGLRQELVTQCMQRLGYSPVRLPRCTTAAGQTGAQSLPDRQPPLTKGSCLRKDDSGDWRITAP